MRKQTHQLIARAVAPLAAALLLAFCAACTGDDGGSAARDAGTADVSADTAVDVEPDAGRAALSLVDHEAWRLLGADEDPFDDAPPEINCSPQAFGVEPINNEPALKVDSRDCNYLTVAQPTAADIVAGQAVQIRLWHFALTAPADSQAHLALHLAGQTIWEERVPIPSDSQLLLADWTAPTDIPAGSQLVFHLHNHGDNEYYLIEVSKPAED